MLNKLLMALAVVLVVLVAFVIDGAQKSSQTLQSLIIEQENANRGFDQDIRFREQ